MSSFTLLMHRIFRTDYGHTEVAAHFGNGKPSYIPFDPMRIVYLSSSNLDPREYCISTKEFVLEDGKLKGLNTGTYRLFFSL